MTMPYEKYQPFERIELPDRIWPDNRIRTAPIWCSVDLRDGNQALITPMGLDEKIEFFQMLLGIGFRQIEVGFPSAAQVEFDFLRTLVERDLIPDGVAVQVLTQARDHLIRRTFEALEGVKKAVLHIYNSTSVLQRSVVFRKDREEIKQIAVDGAKRVREEREKIARTEVLYQYSPESFTGTEVDYAVEICAAVADVLEPTPDQPMIVNLPATVEMDTPNVYADQIEYFIRHIPRRDSLIISSHNHNDRGTAVASTELSLMAGAQRVEGTLFGNGERTGNVDLVTLAMNLMVQGIDPGLDFSHIDDIVACYERICKLPVHQRHPYAGELVYTAFSGSHQDAINKGMKAYHSGEQKVWAVPYLPIDPRDVGRDYEAIIRINSQSGKGGIAYLMEREFGFRLPKDMHPEFASVIQRLSDQTGEEISSQQIYETFQEEYIRRSRPFKLKRADFHGNEVGDDDQTETESTVMIEVNGEEKRLNGRGNGPVDAFSHSLKETGLADFSLSAYHEHALDQGADSKAVAYVKVETAAGSFFGAGVDSNISIAPIKALLSALNRAQAAEAA